jgi:hypothetical protein
VCKKITERLQMKGGAAFFVRPISPPLREEQIVKIKKRSLRIALFATTLDL